jgi:hypothetical protein
VQTDSKTGDPRYLNEEASTEAAELRTDNIARSSLETAHHE